MAKRKENRQLETVDQHKREFLREVDAFRGSKRPYDIFRDFCEMAAICFASIDLRQKAAREERYLQIIKGYDAEDRQRFPRLLGLATLSFERNGPHDFFGELFDGNGLNLGSKGLGQFFTPYTMSLMMAQMMLADVKQMVEADPGGFITLQEPCSGGGGMIAAAAEAVEKEGLNYQQVMHVTAIDVDPRCVHMTFLTCSLLHIPAMVCEGNSLSSDPPRSIWYTPAHILGGWNAKLAARRERQKAADIELKFREMPLLAAAE